MTIFFQNGGYVNMVNSMLSWLLESVKSLCWYLKKGLAEFVWEILLFIAARNKVKPLNIPPTGTLESQSQHQWSEGEWVRFSQAVCHSFSPHFLFSQVASFSDRSNRSLCPIPIVFPISDFFGNLLILCLHSLRPKPSAWANEEAEFIKTLQWMQMIWSYKLVLFE